MFRRVTSLSVHKATERITPNRCPPTSLLTSVTAPIVCSLQWRGLAGSNSNMTSTSADPNKNNNTAAAAAATNNINDDSDDFVDIMFPGDEGGTFSSGLTSSHYTAATPVITNSVSVLSDSINAEEDDVILGIQRDEPLRENEEITRLGVRRIKSADGTRMNTRAASLQDDPNSHTSLVKAAGDQFDEDDDDEDGGSEIEDGEESDDEDFEPDEDLKGIELPYDDEKFAEAILQMEVEGQLDESWQNQRTAKKEDCAAIVDILKHMKARDLCCIDVSGKTSSFDFMIFATCEGPRHVHLCSWSISKADRESRTWKPKRKTSDRTWEAVPVGRIIVNLMTDNYRNQVSFERKWAVTKTMDPLDHANASVGEGRVIKSHGLWTLTLNLQDLEDFEVDYCKDALLAQL